jgi:hypothetical protein
MVGLADAAVQEARERVRAALRNSGLRVPLTRVVVSQAPADLRKAGPAFDLPIALGLLVASGQLAAPHLEGIWSAAELGLDGRLRPIRGVLAMAMAARQAGARGLVVANTPDVLSYATAEIAFTLMLMAARRAGEGERLLRAGNWGGWAPTQLMGVTLEGKKLGILGMGRIGRELAKMARGFSMEVHYRNRSRLSAAEEAGAIFHAEDASFLAGIDVLSMHIPGGAATRHWLNAGRPLSRVGGRRAP